MDKVLLFGKDDCPYTNGAREDYTNRGIDFEYINVKKSKDGMKKMLEYSGGRREVPVIVEGNKVTIGFDGGT
ncbi:MAG TPA: UXX-star selenoprotein family 1 [Candidatus Hypogeohydataceae bacterium YC41]